MFGGAARGGGAGGVEECGEGLEGQGAGEDDGEGGVDLGDYGVGDGTVCWVGEGVQGVFEEGEAEGGGCDEACSALIGDLGVTWRYLAYKTRRERIVVATVFWW